MDMFSQRTNWPLGANPLMAKLESLRLKGETIIDLTESNPTRCGFSYPSDQILSPLADSQNLIYAPVPQGPQSAREAVAQYYRNKKIDVRPENIFITASTSEAYAFLFRLLVNPGERVLVPSPSYPLFEYLAQLNDVELDYYALQYNGSWRVDMDSLARAVTQKTKAVLFVSPNNPTGSFLKRSEWTAIHKICLKNNLALICDEVFADYYFVHDADRVASVAENKEVLTFSLAGASKSLGLPQMKIGWGVVGGPEPLVRGALERLDVILDTYLSVNTPSVNALPRWLDSQALIQKEIFRHLRPNRQYVIDSTQNSDCACLKIEGGWSAILQLPAQKDEVDWSMEFLEKDHVLVHPGYFFDLVASETESFQRVIKSARSAYFKDGDFIVLSLLLTLDVFQEGLTRILKRIRTG